nr:DUF3311 domain-containing protein [Lichenibacterium sp. 6Y81]
MVQRTDGRPLRDFDDSAEGRKRHSPWLWLLLIPYPALLWVPFYNAVEPRFFGFPFFYTYQMAFVVFTAILTGFVFLVTD